MEPFKDGATLRRFFEGRLISYTKDVKDTKFLNKKTGTMEASKKIGKIWSLYPATREKATNIINSLEAKYVNCKTSKRN